MAGLVSSIGHAQIIFSNAFNGGAVTINKTAPTVANSVAGGTNKAVWTLTYTNIPNLTDGGWLENGAIGTNAGSALLPFIPQAGSLYFFTASVTLPSSMNNWLAMGFAQNDIQGTSPTAERFTDGNVKGGPWFLMATPGTSEQLFGGPETSLETDSGNLITGAGTYTLTIILNTLGTQWTASAFVNGSIMGTNVVGGKQMGTNIVYATNPFIQFAGFSQQGLTSVTGIQWHYLALSTALVPVITQQPMSGAVSVGVAYTNTVMAIADTNTGTFSYQWYANGLAIGGATNAALMLNPVTASNAGTNYYAVVTDNYGAVTSAVAGLTVYVTNSPTISATFPVTYTNPLTLLGGGTVNGTNYIGSTPTFSVSVYGTQPFAYQWLTNGVAMGGATNGSFTFTNCLLTSPTNFTCYVTNNFGAVTSAWSVVYLPTPTAPYAQNVLAAQPIGYWRLNESDNELGNGNPGAICHDYENGNNGIYTNINLSQVGYNPTKEPTETAALFGGAGVSTNYSYAGQIQGVDFAAGNGANGEFTVEAWAKGYANVQTNGAPVITEGIYGVNDEFALSMDTSSAHHYQFYVRSASGTVYTADSSFAPDGNWHHLVGICDETNGLVSLYIDGRPAAAAAIPANSGVYEANLPLSIGAGLTNSATGYNLQWRGLIDDVAAYDYAISPAQVVTQYSTNGGTVAPFFVQLPSTNITIATGGTLTLSAQAAGTPSLTGIWHDPNGNVLATLSTNGFLLNAPLRVTSISSSWNGGQLELSATNAYGFTNVYFNLTVLPTSTTTINPNSILVNNFQGWGTSLSWWANVIGGFPNRNDYMNLVFNTLKLNIVRYAIGAGQNPAINYTNTPYKAIIPGYELTNGVWNWNVDFNQRWVLQAAQARGANLVEAFADSPPWWMCVNSNIDGNLAGTNNLQVACEGAFATYLTIVVSNLTVLDGDHFTYLTPMNEPSLGTTSDVDSGYEYCHMSNDQQQRMVNDVRADLNISAPSVGVDASEDYDEYEAYVDLSAYSSTVLGNLSLLSTHTYIANSAANLKSEAAAQNKPLWVAEYSDTDGTGMIMAQHIHDDITGMCPVAWCYWLAVDSDVGKGFLYNPLVASTNSGYTTAIVYNPKFYVMAQYSEFIRPGCEIISASDASTIAAYNPTNASLVLVADNTNSTAYSLTYNLPSFSSFPWQQVAVFQTSTNSNMVTLPTLSITNKAFTAIIPANSVTTFVLLTNPVVPAIVAQSPAPYTNMALYPGESPAFSITATGTPPLYYQWISNSVAVPGANGTNYMPAGAALNSTVAYECIVSNVAGSATSKVWSVSAVLAPTTSYPTAALALNPIGFWPLNEAEQGHGDDGVIARDYISGNNGIYTNALLGQPTYNALTDPSTTSALFGYVATNNSCVYGILAPDFSLTNGASAEFAISAWVNSTGTNGLNTPTIAAKGYYYQEEYALDAGAANASFRFSVRDAAGAAFNASSTVSLTNTGKWYHLVGVCDEANGLVLLYTNGMLAATSSIPVASGITNSAGTPMTIGARASHSTTGNDQQFPGYISDVAVYNYALNSVQIQTLYSAGVTLASAGLTFTSVGNGSQQLQLNWSYGTLQTATNVTGPYLDMTNATQPYLVPPTNRQQYFRIREN